MTFAEDFKKIVKSEITTWRDWHEAWFKLAEEFPVFFFRFEDLTADAETVLRAVFCFVLGIDDSQLVGTVLEAAIKKSSEKKPDGQAVGQLYKPRKATSNGNLHRFDPEQLNWAKSELAPLLSFFGYNAEPTNFFPEIPTQTRYA